MTGCSSLVKLGRIGRSGVLPLAVGHEMRNEVMSKMSAKVRANQIKDKILANEGQDM